MDTRAPRDDGAHDLRAIQASFEAKLRAAQKKSVPGREGFTYRDLANALTLLSFRNSVLEDLHAGNDSPLRHDPSLSRLTNEEMKKLMIETSALLALHLHNLFENPAEFAKNLRYAEDFIRDWEREAVHDEPRD